MQTTVLVLLVACALALDFTDGFHDAAHAIATSISTRVLTPRAALATAGVLKLVGALVVAKIGATVEARDYRHPDQ